MSWSGVKKQTNYANIEAWCEEMGIKRYTINSKGEIDVDGNVILNNKDFKELPYKFGTITISFNISGCKNLTSLKNCPNYVGRWFACDNCSVLNSLEGCPKKVGGDFYCNNCSQLDSLKGCPNEIEQSFCCENCKRKFTKEEVRSLCNVKKYIYNL